jgi:predicted RNA-binding Zn-ribbon protein involved in translation (DUF1610 family)
MLRLMQRGDPAAASFPLGDDEAAWPPPEMAHRLVLNCDECGTRFYASESYMATLCPECAHYLHGYPACEHQLVGGRCLTCGWDGSHSPLIMNLKAALRRR